MYFGSIKIINFFFPLWSWVSFERGDCRPWSTPLRDFLSAKMALWRFPEQSVISLGERSREELQGERSIDIKNIVKNQRKSPVVFFDLAVCGHCCRSRCLENQRGGYFRSMKNKLFFLPWNWISFERNKCRSRSTSLRDFLSAKMAPWRFPGQCTISRGELVSR